MEFDSQHIRLHLMMLSLSSVDKLSSDTSLSVVCIYRSPGGTPINKRPAMQTGSSSADPAAIIAAALKKKFAHKAAFSSPDKNRYVEY